MNGREGERRPVSARQVAIDLPKRSWWRAAWQEGSDTPLASRFAAVRVRPAHGDDRQSAPRPEEWLLIEWPAGAAEPTKDRFATLPETTPRRALVDLAKLRWRTERDARDLEHGLGLGHYEGRGWRGFHHHATLCIAVHGFLISERAMVLSPGGNAPSSF